MLCYPRIWKIGIIGQNEVRRHFTNLHAFCPCRKDFLTRRQHRMNHPGPWLHFLSDNGRRLKDTAGIDVDWTRCHSIQWTCKWANTWLQSGPLLSKSSETYKPRHVSFIQKMRPSSTNKHNKDTNWLSKISHWQCQYLCYDKWFTQQNLSHISICSIRVIFHIRSTLDFCSHIQWLPRKDSFSVFSQRGKAKKMKRIQAMIISVESRPFITFTKSSSLIATTKWTITRNAGKFENDPSACHLLNRNTITDARGRVPGFSACVERTHHADNIICTTRDHGCSSRPKVSPSP